MCQQFLYGGCFPNENNFFNQHDCEDKCSGKHISIAQDFVHYLILLLEFYLIVPFKLIVQTKMYLLHCIDCYPVCTPEYCAIKRRGTCSV